MVVPRRIGLSIPNWISGVLDEQFHFRSESALRVGSPLGFFIGPCIPDMRAQKDLRRLAALEFGSSLEGGVVTAVFSLLPGFSRR